MKIYNLILLVSPLLLSIGCADRYSTASREPLPSNVYLGDARASELAALESFEFQANALNNGIMPSVFSLVSNGNNDVDANYNNQVLQIRSERSTAGPNPSVWYVVYADKAGSQQPVELRFDEGKLAAKSQTLSGPTPVSSTSDALDLSQIRYDADAAFNRALQEAGKTQTDISSSSLRLESQNSRPVWRVKLWDFTSKDLGEFSIAADTGDHLKLNK